MERRGIIGGMPSLEKKDGPFGPSDWKRDGEQRQGEILPVLREPPPPKPPEKKPAPNRLK